MAGRRDPIRFHRPVVWIAGASRGIGLEIAKQFASIGCVVCLSSRKSRLLRSAVLEIRESGGSAQSYRCDISRQSSILRTTRNIRREHGEIEVLVVCAGITVFKSFLNTSLKEFDAIIGTNLRGQIACIKAVLPSMVKRRQGWIFSILSNAAVKTFEDSAAYTATKAGMLGLGRVLREELRPHRVKVVNILPGATETGMWSSAMRKKYSHRMMKARSVGEAVLSIYRMPDDLVVDEMVVRPLAGDID
jgi:short-subunit dehydrogenase